MKLVAVELEEKNNKPLIHLFERASRTKVNHIVDGNFKPHFYIRKDELDRFKGVIRFPKPVSFLPTDRKSIFGDELIKVTTELPQDVRNVRTLFSSTFQADVRFIKLYLVEAIDRLEAPDYRWAFLDTEWSTEQGLIDPQAPTTPCIAISVFDNYTEKCYSFTWRKGHPYTVTDTEWGRMRIYDSEKAMLWHFLKFIRDFDFDGFVGQNLLKFDIPALINRLEMLYIPARQLSRLHFAGQTRDGYTVQGRVLVDFLTLYKKWRTISGLPNLDSYSLTNIVREEEVEKTPLEDYSDKVTEIWMRDLEELCRGNALHAKWVYMLNAKLKILEFFDELRRLCFCLWSDFEHTLSFLDQYFLKQAKLRGMVLPTKSALSFRSYKGALVFRPVVGIREWVGLFDIRSMYPNIICTLNFSPETVKEDGQLDVGNGVRIDTSVKGFIPTVYDNLFKLRNERKERLKHCKVGSSRYVQLEREIFALKTVLNAIYGALGNEHFRLADLRLAESVTFVERNIMDQVAKNFNVLYGDTDSVFIQLSSQNLDEAVSAGQVILTKLNDFLANRLKMSGIEFEFKALFRRLLFFPKTLGEGEAAKKKYVGLVLWKNGNETSEVEVVGLESKRSDTSRFTRGMMRKICELIAEGKTDKVLTYARTKVNEFLQGKVSLEDAGIPKGINIPLKSYKNPTPWVRGALYLNEYLGGNVQVGSKVRLLYVHPSSMVPATDIVAFERISQLPNTIKVNWQEMLVRSVKPKVEKLLELIGLSWDDLFYVRKSLLDW